MLNRKAVLLAVAVENVMQVALNCEVNFVVANSTDKASAPIKPYGATKLASDNYVLQQIILNLNKIFHMELP